MKSQEQSDASRDSSLFRPTAPLANLRRRADLLKRARHFFDQRGFMEVTTPVLSADTMIDSHVEPLRVTMFRDPCEVHSGPTWFLQTSPEFHMKRLLADGATAIYQVGPAFRAGESGPLHNVEFTMLEWYRCGDDMQAGMQLLADLAVHLLGTKTVQRISYADAFHAALHVDPHVVTTDRLRDLAREFRSRDARDERDDLLHLLWSSCIEPGLGKDLPVIVYDYPASQPALAEVREETPPVAKRFELYFRGVELANGYQELRDPDELRHRIREAAFQRKRSGKPPLPGHNRLIEALISGIPPTTGVAMGFDRMTMLALGERNIEKVVAFAFERA